eukprot:214171-Pelagomonas_calceolata.AAC.1
MQASQNIVQEEGPHAGKPESCTNTARMRVIQFPAALQQRGLRLPVSLSFASVLNSLFPCSCAQQPASLFLFLCSKFC